MSRKGSDTAADVSEIAANIAITVMGLMTFFFDLIMFFSHWNIVFSRLINGFGFRFTNWVVGVCICEVLLLSFRFRRFDSNGVECAAGTSVVGF